MKTRTMIFVTLLALAGGAGAQNLIGTPEFDPLGEHLDLAKEVRVIVEFIEVSQEYVTTILYEERNGMNDNDLRAKVLEEVKKKEDARMIDTSIVTTRSGQRAKVESTEEKIYPTEFDPPVAAASKDKDGNGKEVVAPPLPTAFEMRPVGITLEVDPVIGADGVSVDLNIAPEIVYQNDDTLFAKWKTKEAEAEITQPVFYSLKMSTSITLISGQAHLAGVLSPKDEKGRRDGSRKVLLFVRADILLAGK
jgi:hypothetical protein